MHLADHGFLAPISLFWTLPCQRPRHDAKGTNTTHDASLLSPPQDTHLPSAPSSAGLSPNPLSNSLLPLAPAPPFANAAGVRVCSAFSLFLFRPPGLISSHASPVHSFCPPQRPLTRPASLDVIVARRTGSYSRPPWPNRLFPCRPGQAAATSVSALTRHPPLSAKSAGVAMPASTRARSGADFFFIFPCRLRYQR